MATFTVHQAKTELSKLIARAEAGEEIVIARRDKPAVRLLPVMAETAKAEGLGASRVDPLPRQEPGPGHDIGFAEDGPQGAFDVSEISKNIDAGKEFTLLRNGKPVARVSPFAPGSPESRGYGMFAHLPPIPDSFFFDPLPEEELKLWEGED